MSAKEKHDLMAQGYEKVLSLLRESCTENGFLASLNKKDNYKRIWSRDGSMLSLASLMTEEPGLIRCVKNTLFTLAD